MSNASPEMAVDSAARSRESGALPRTRFEVAFRDFVQHPDFPCLGAKGAVRLDSYTLRTYGAIGEGGDAKSLVADLATFSASIGDDTLSAFVAVFPQSPPGSEPDFERRLWAHLQLIHEADPVRGHWARGVSPDPDDPHFAFSVGGHAFFVIGLHPLSSRLARRFEWPTLV